MDSKRTTRRKFLGSIGVAGAGLALTTGMMALDPTRSTTSATSAIVPFHGTYQAGITTPAQERLFIASFDLTTNNLDAVRTMLQQWTAAAEMMTVGKAVGAVDGSPYAAPDDTGEAIGLTAANLTITVGFGPTFFDKDGQDRFGLASQRPEALVDLPAFAGDTLRPEQCGGDIVVQACADDAQVTFHAIRNLARIARGTAVIRWSQLGFGRTSSTSRAQDTPRNLMGFKDGTNNLKLEDTDLLAQQLWVGANDQPAWMHGGTYMVSRRIRMLIEVWDRSSLLDQDQTFGRQKVSGAPIGGHDEFETLDFDATDAQGERQIPEDSHIALAAPQHNNGAHLLRRGYSFTDGMDYATGQLDAGLFFICFQRDPRTQFIPIQRHLATDRLNEYIRHTGSAIFAIPPGVQPGGFFGDTLLG